MVKSGATRCLDDEAGRIYLADGLPLAISDAVETHVETCERCQRLLETLSNDKAVAFKALFPPPASGAFLPTALADRLNGLAPEA